MTKMTLLVIYVVPAGVDATMMNMICFQLLIKHNHHLFLIHWFVFVLLDTVFLFYNQYIPPSTPSLSPSPSFPTMCTSSSPLVRLSIIASLVVVIVVIVIVPVSQSSNV